MDLEIYLHIPFCEKKCGYCDFLSAPADIETRHAYVDRLTEEIAFYGRQYADANVTSIFLGGGTPSILEGKYLADILKKIRLHYRVASNAEITIECNPGTMTHEKAIVLFRAGYNRISLGLQSADNLELAMLGRIHTYQKFLETYDLVRRAGFDNVNVDLMSALPGQTPDSWEHTLKQVSALQPEHISAYSLMIEEGTPFYNIYHREDEARARGEETSLLPSEEKERLMYIMTDQILAERHYEKYEISNYARPGYECRHNIGYWTRKNYLGLGLGASSFIDNVRFENTSDLGEYFNRSFHHLNLQPLDRKNQMEEFMFLGLRMTRGVAENSFLEAFSVPMDSVYGEPLARLENLQLLVRKDGRVYLTPRGVDVSNRVLAEFLL